MYQAYYDREHKRFRIGITIDGETKDLCGAVDEMTAIVQADLLNRMRKFKQYQQLIE